MIRRIVLTSWLLLLVPILAAATVTLPKTGQTLCYDATGPIDCANTGQDGETQIGAAWPSPRFTDNLNGTVTDNLTGLIWLKDAVCAAINPPPANPSVSEQGGADWASALMAVKSLKSGECGLSDGSVAGTWRVPNVNEFESLMDISQVNPPLPKNNPFTSLTHPYLVYWTSTTTADYFPGINAIGADLVTGTIQGDARNNPKLIWPVKGDSTTLPKTGQNGCWDANDNAIPCNGNGSDGDLQKGVPLPYPRFYDNANGTVTDSLTGLIWLRNAGCFSNITSQRQAITDAKSLANGVCDLSDGSVPGDWRLPNRKEMRSLRDYVGSRWLAEFPNSPDHGWYWTSNAYVAPGFTSDSWMVKSQGLDWLASTLLTYQQLPPYFALPVRGPLKIQLITFNAPATIRYGDPPLNLSTITTGGGSGNPVTFTLVSGPATLNGSTLTFTGGGSVVVKAAQAGNAIYSPAADTPHTFVVDGAVGTVVITPADLVRTYDGTPKAVTATTSPAGLPVTFRYAGSATPPTNAGTYLVQATIDDPTHPGSASANLVIGKAAGTLTLGGLNQTYDGTARRATATTVPAGGDVVFTYAGSSAAPVDAGSYPVVATISDPNFQASTASGTLIIAKASCTVTLGGLSQVYDGTVKSATATTSPAGRTAIFSYTPANPVDVGSYAVVATVSDENYSGTASGTMTIAKAPCAVTLGGLSQVYDGTVKSATAITSPAGRTVIFSYTPANPVDAGSYAVVATVSDENYSGTASGTLTIAKASCAVTLGGLSQVYDGTVKSATAITSPAGRTAIFSYTPANPVDAGSYAVVATVSDNNYSGTASGTMTIAKTPCTVTLGGLSQVYDGTVKSATAITRPAGRTVIFSYTPANPVDVGSYAVVATVSDNYYSGTASGTLTVTAPAPTTFQVTGSVPGGNGSISCTSPVISGATATCTLTPATGYHLVALTDNAADRFAAVSGETYSISGVVAEHTVTAVFARPDGILNPTDGKTAPDISDAVMLLHMVLGNTGSTKVSLAHADIAPLTPDGKPSGDGKLDIYDVIGLLRMVVGL